jgi:hypothetical protein
MAIDALDVAFPVVDQVGTHSVYITGLYPFTLPHCGPSPPCVRFVDVVTFADATLGTRCRARASEAGFYPRLTQPSFARRSNKGTYSLIGIKLLQRFQALRATSEVPKFSIFEKVRQLAKLLKIHSFLINYESFRSYVGRRPMIAASSPQVIRTVTFWNGWAGDFYHWHHRRVRRGRATL